MIAYGYVWLVWKHTWDIVDRHWRRDVYRVFAEKRNALECCRKNKMCFLGKRKLMDEKYNKSLETDGRKDGHRSA